MTIYLNIVWSLELSYAEYRIRSYEHGLFLTSNTDQRNSQSFWVHAGTRVEESPLFSDQKWEITDVQFGEAPCFKIKLNNGISQGRYLVSHSDRQENGDYRVLVHETNWKEHDECWEFIHVKDTRYRIKKTQSRQAGSYLIPSQNREAGGLWLDVSSREESIEFSTWVIEGFSPLECWTITPSQDFLLKFIKDNRAFSNKLDCMSWCDQDSDCKAVGQSKDDMCYKLVESTSLSTHTIVWNQVAELRCWLQYKVKATTTTIRDDYQTVALCGKDYMAINCDAPFLTGSVLDGVIINNSSCAVIMSAYSGENVHVTTTCSPSESRLCSTTGITQPFFTYKTTGNGQLSGTQSLSCDEDYLLLGCYYRSAWAHSVPDFGTAIHEARVTGDTCSYTSSTGYQLTAVCRIRPEMRNQCLHGKLPKFIYLVSSYCFGCPAKIKVCVEYTGY